MDTFWIASLAKRNIVYPLADFERCIIALEFTCAEKLRLKASQNLTFDTNVVCDVCRSPNASPADEMVFCDGCNLCVHQKCYGIHTVPDGDWLCSPCSKRLKRETVSCILCPSKLGALKPVADDGTLLHARERVWCHLSCALWIPETFVADLALMQPIMGVDQIPPARWKLLCYICKEKEGACIQCAVRTCLKSFHVTCAVKGNLCMKITSPRKTAFRTKAISSDGHLSYFRPSKGSPAFVAFCYEHGENIPQTDEHGYQNPSIELRDRNWKDPSTTGSPTKILKEFYKLVDVRELSQSLQMDKCLVQATAVYWKHKRILNKCRPLIPNMPTSKVNDSARWMALCEYVGLEVPNNDGIWCARLITQVRQQLETVRMLAYLITRRERMKREKWEILRSEATPMVERLTGLYFQPNDKSVGRVPSIVSTEDTLSSGDVIVDEPLTKRGRGRPRKKVSLTMQSSAEMKRTNRRIKRQRRCRPSISPEQSRRHECLSKRDSEMMAEILRDESVERKSRATAGLRCSQRTLVKYTRLNIRRFIAFDSSKAKDGKGSAVIDLKRRVGRPRKNRRIMSVSSLNRSSEEASL